MATKWNGKAIQAKADIANKKAFQKLVKKTDLYARRTAKSYNLYHTIGYIIEYVMGKLQATMGYKTDGPASAYAKYVEYGRKAGKQPPLSAILEWIENKKIALASTAYAIARHIGKHGVEGKFLITNAFQRNRDEFVALLKKSYREEFK